MDTVTLPFELNTISSQYLDHTYALGIIQANTRIHNIDIMPWVCRKFIFCKFSLKQHDLNRFVIGKLNPTDECKITELPFQIFKDNILTNNSHCIIDLVKLFIRDKYYVSGNFNEKYVPGMPSYKIKNYDHIYLLYGYDDKDDTFLSSGFLADQRYTPYKIRYNDFFDSLMYTSFDSVNFCLKKYSQNGQYFMSIDEIIEELEIYLNMRKCEGTLNDTKEVYGVAAIKELSNFYYDSICNNNISIFDLRYTRGLVDSKRILVEILKYLYSYYKMDINPYINFAEEVSYYARLVHNCGIKYNINRRIKIIEGMQKYFQRIIDIELSYLPSVLHDLKALVPFI